MAQPSNVETKNLRRMPGVQFFYTTKTSAACKSSGQLYEKPLHAAMEAQTEGTILIKIEESVKGGTHTYFGAPTLHCLSNAWQTDNHAYEILREDRKPYFDIE